MLATAYVRRLDASESDDDSIDKLAFDVVLRARIQPGDLVLFAAGDVVTVGGTVVEGSATIANREPNDTVAIPRGAGDRPPCLSPGGHVVSGYVVIRAG